MTDNIHLPFDGKFQAALIYLLITDYDFLRATVEELSQRHFDAGETHIKLFRLVKLIWDKTKRPLTINIVKNTIVQLKAKGTYSEGDSFGMNNILDSGKLFMPSEYEFVKENVYAFLKRQTMALAFAESLDYYEKGDYDEVYSIMGKAYKKSFGIENTLGLSYKDESVHDRYLTPPRTGIWKSGFDGLDAYIDGGFAKKEAATVLASTGRGKCLSVDTPVIMSNGTVKLVQDVKTGDKLMGPDGKSRNVLSTVKGYGQLYKIIPVKGDSYVVNDVHLLSLKCTGLSHDIILSNGTRIKKGNTDPIFVEAKVLYDSNKTVKHCLKGWRPEAVSFENEATNHVIPPYILGVWLGDGTSAKPLITQIPNAVSEEFTTYAESIGCRVIEVPYLDEKCSSFNLVDKGKGHKNKFTEHLKQLGVLRCKHIPKDYILTSIENRLELLAGLLDTDGALHYEGYDFVQKDRQLAEDVVFIARSLGYAVNISKCTKTIKDRNFSGEYWRVTISGDCSNIPVRLDYKKAKPRKQKKNHLVTGLKIEPAGYGDYYGFELDGDKQFLLGDWQVTHNTSLLVNFAVAAIKQKLKTVFVTLEMTEAQIAQRCDSIISGFSASELGRMPEARIELQRILDEELQGCKPYIKGFDRGKLSAQGLRTYLERFSMEHGFPDVVMLDWIGCMRLSSSLEKRHEALAEAADEVINMSREFQCSMITSHQTNRQACGVSQFSYGVISESFSSLFGFDLAMTLGSSEKEQDAGKRTLGIVKNRMGPDSVYVNLQGSKPNEPLTFKFVEVPKEEEEAELLNQES